MTPTVDLLGVWRPCPMYALEAQLCDVLVFNEDGTGFLDFSNPAIEYFNEEFRWSLSAPAELLLRGDRIRRFTGDGTGTVGQPSMLDAVVAFSLQTETTNAGRHT